MEGGKRKHRASAHRAYQNGPTTAGFFPTFNPLLI